MYDFVQYDLYANTICSKKKNTHKKTIRMKVLP